MEQFVGTITAKVWEAEYQKDGVFTRSLAIACDFVDQTIRRSKCEPGILRRFFSEILSSYFQASTDKAMQDEAAEVLNSVMNLLQLVVDFVGLPSGPEFAEERAVATIKMISYFINTEQSAYFRYVHTLYNEYMATEPPSYVEAASTLLQHAFKLPWTDENLPLMGIDSVNDPLPAEKSWERRSRLYQMAIVCFDRCRLYERSIELYRELVEQYRIHKDYAMLSTVLQEEAKEYEELDAASSSRLRVLPPFFLICYSGFGFPVSVANRRFVQRADSDDTAETVASRLMRKFPDAEMRITSADSINLDDLSGAIKVVAILPLRPSSEDEIAGFDALFPSKMPLATRQYLLFNNTSVFTDPRPENADGADIDGVRHFFVTEEPLPTNRRSVAVLRTIERRQTPLLREVSWLSSKLNEIELRIISFKRVSRHTEETFSDFSHWAVQTFEGFIHHLREITIPDFIKPQFHGNESNLQERIHEILARLSRATRELVVAHNKEVTNPVRVSSHTRICDLATEVLTILAFK